MDEEGGQQQREWGKRMGGYTQGRGGQTHQSVSLTNYYYYYYV